MRHLIPFLASLAFALPAMAHKAHVHGEGQLDVVIDEETITLDLELPLDAAVGFERAPRNDKEKAALAEAEKILKNASNLWLPTPAARCALHSLEVKMPNLSESGHADINALYVFRCAVPAELKGIETTLFKNFTRLYRIDVQRAGPSGQGAQRLSPKKLILAW